MSYTWRSLHNNFCRYAHSDLSIIILFHFLQTLIINSWNQIFNRMASSLVTCSVSGLKSVKHISSGVCSVSHMLLHYCHGDVAWR